MVVLLLLAVVLGLVVVPPTLERRRRARHWQQLGDTLRTMHHEALIARIRATPWTGSRTSVVRHWYPEAINHPTYPL